MPQSTADRLFSIAVVIDDAWLAWGECAVPGQWMQQRGGANRVPSLSERITPLLGGQPVDSFRRLVELLNGVVTVSDDVLGLPSVRSGIQQALLAAVARTTGKQPLDVAAAEYELPVRSAARPTTLLLDVGNDVATADRIAEMIALAPAGLGYRLAVGAPEESIGPDAEYLQQFVRELRSYLPTVLPDATYQPSLLLRLNGALGDLTPDPRQHIGKVLGHLVGLEQAAQPWPLWVSDPLRLQGLSEQAATLRRLRLFMRRRDMAAKLVVEAGPTNLADLDLLLQSEAFHAVLVEWGRWADLDQMLQTAAACALHDASFMAAGTPSLTPAQLTLLVDLFGRLDHGSLVISMTDGSSEMPVLATMLVGRQAIAQEQLSAR